MKSLLLILFFAQLNLVFSQDTLSLEQCIEFAVKNETHYIQERYDLNKNLLRQKFDKLSILPNLSANTSYNLNFGRKLDLFTNTFATNTVQSSNMGLSTNMLLFNGARYSKQKSYNRLVISKSKLAIETRIEIIKLNVTQKYIELLKIRYNIENQLLTIENLGKFKKQQELLLKNGRLSKLDTLETAVRIKTLKLEISRLNQDYKLKVIDLNFDCGFPLDRKPEFKSIIEICSACKVKIKEAKDLELIGIEQEVDKMANKIAKGIYLPSLSLNGNVNTGYSTNNKDYSLPGTPVKPYQDQINSNLYQSVGLSLNVPIYNKGELTKNKRNTKLIEDFYAQKKEEKERELLLKKMEIQQKINSTKELLSLTEELLAQKTSVYKLTEILYFEGKISLPELELKLQELDEIKKNLVTLNLELLLNSVYEW